MRLLLPLLCLMSLLACRKPDRALPPPERPLVIQLTVNGEGAVSQETEHAWGEAFRDRLSAQAKILPAGTPPGDAAVLEIEVEPLGRAQAVGKSTANASGRAFGAGWDAIKTRSGRLQDQVRAGVGGLLVGTAFALVTAPVQAAATQTAALGHQVRLGFKPRHVVLTCRYQPSPQADPVVVLSTQAMEVVKRMRPMSAQEAHQPGRLASEEARAAAELVSERLSAMGWR